MVLEFCENFAGAASSAEDLSRGFDVLMIKKGRGDGKSG